MCLSGNDIPGTECGITVLHLPAFRALPINLHGLLDKSLITQIISEVEFCDLLVPYEKCKY